MDYVTDARIGIWFGRGLFLCESVCERVFVFMFCVGEWWARARVREKHRERTGGFWGRASWVVFLARMSKND